MNLPSSAPRLRLGATTLAACFALCLADAALAQWKWRDKSGQVQYSDLPPPASVTEGQILQRPGASSRRPPAPPAGAAASAAPPLLAASGAASTDPELEAKRRKAEEEATAKRKAEEEKINAAKAENCHRAKAHLRGLDDGLRIARVNDKGEREILDDKGRAEESKRARNIISSDCK